MAREPFLKTDNPVFSFMGKLGDVVVLNLAWLLCCVPVATIGASTTALFYVARKICLDEDYRVWHDFFHSFRANWKQATGLWLMLLAGLAVAASNLWIGLHTDSGLGNLCRGVGIVLLLVWLMAEGFAFPLLARFELSFRHLAEDALLLGLAHFPRTVGVIGLNLLPAVLWYVLPSPLLCVLFVWLPVGFALAALWVEKLLEPVFAPYRTESV